MSSSKEETKNDRLYKNITNNILNYTSDRIDFINLMLEDTDLLPMFDKHMMDVEMIKEIDDINIIFNKKTLNLTDALKKFGNQLVYIGSGTTGHTFKGMAIPDPSRPEMELNYALKVVAYPRESSYGKTNNITRPENVELLMLKLLSYFVVKRHTPHIILPITTFNTDIKTFIKLNSKEKSKKFKKFKEDVEKGMYHSTVSVLISEWANGGDLLEYLRAHYSTLTIKEWRLIFFHVISVLAVIQNKYPGFRHNDLKPNNVLIQHLCTTTETGKTFTYVINDRKFYVPNTGIRCKIWDFDFACIPGIIDNAKVYSEWTNDINVKPEPHPYYDVHYFFNTMSSTHFLPNFFTRDNNDMPYVPDEVTDFVKRIVPKHIRSGKYVSESGRLLLSYDELKEMRGLFYTTPFEILTKDPFFSKMRDDSS